VEGQAESRDSTWLTGNGKTVRNSSNSALRKGGPCLIQALTSKNQSWRSGAASALWTSLSTGTTPGIHKGARKKVGLCGLYGIRQWRRTHGAKDLQGETCIVSIAMRARMKPTPTGFMIAGKLECFGHLRSASSIDFNELRVAMPHSPPSPSNNAYSQEMSDSASNRSSGSGFISWISFFRTFWNEHRIHQYVRDELLVYSRIE
jgi:hypothetical protein